MKVSEMIKNLQKFLEEHGDLDCYYAKDDEGNGYQRVHYEPSLFYAKDDDDDVYSEDNYKEMLEECDGEDDAIEMYPICVVN